MSHMPTSSQPSNTGTVSGLIIVAYTATGSEGTSFSVSIGQTMADTNYSVMWAPQGMTNFPLLDLPTAGRTTTAFPVTTAVQFAAGEVLHFWITET